MLAKDLTGAIAKYIIEAVQRPLRPQKSTIAITVANFCSKSSFSVKNRGNPLIVDGVGFAKLGVPNAG